MSWTEVEEAIGEAKAIAFDGCHKIYLALDDEQVEQFRGYGYDGDDGSVMIYARNASPSELLTYLHNWFDQSCSLRFINSVRTVEGDPNKGFTTLIGQFEFEEDDEEEEDEL